MSILDELVNFSEVLVDGEHTSAETDVDLQAGQAARLPLDGPFNLVWFDVTNFANPADDPKVEVIRVPAGGIVGDTLTGVDRGVENSGATSKNTPGSQYKMLLSYTKGQREQILVEIQQNLSKFALTAGSSVAYTATLDPVPTAYFNGMTLHLRIHIANGNAPTLAVNGLAAIPLVKQNGIPLSVGDLSIDQGVFVMFSQGKFYGISETLRDTDLVNLTQNTGAVTFSDATTHSITVPTTPASLTDQYYRFIAGTTNNGTHSLKINTLAVVTIKKQGGVNLEAGDIVAGDWITVYHEAGAAFFQLVSSLKTLQNLPPTDFVSSYEVANNAISNGSLANLTFSNNALINGITHVVATADFTITKNGEYDIFYELNVTKTAGGNRIIESVLTKNGVQIAGTSDSVLSTVNSVPLPLSRSILVTCVATDVIRLQAGSDGASTSLIAIGALATIKVTASIKIERQ